MAWNPLKYVYQTVLTDVVRSDFRFSFLQLYPCIKLHLCITMCTFLPSLHAHQFWVWYSPTRENHPRQWLIWLWEIWRKSLDLAW